MQKDDGAHRFTLRFEHKRTIEVLLKMRRIDWAAFEISIGRNMFDWLEFLGNFAPDVVKDLCLSRQILCPVRAIEFFGAQFMRHVGVPGFERQSPLRIVDADGKKRQHSDAEQSPRNFCPLENFPPHWQTNSL